MTRVQERESGGLTSVSVRRPIEAEDSQYVSPIFYSNITGTYYVKLGALLWRTIRAKRCKHSPILDSSAMTCIRADALLLCIRADDLLLCIRADTLLLCIRADALLLCIRADALLLCIRADDLLPGHRGDACCDVFYNSDQCDSTVCGQRILCDWYPFTTTRLNYNQW